jgi:hypothetical protein
MGAKDLLVKPGELKDSGKREGFNLCTLSLKASTENIPYYKINNEFFNCYPEIGITRK